MLLPLMFRLGGIVVLGLLLFSLWIFSKSFEQETTTSKLESVSKAWVDELRKKHDPQWILPTTDLKIVKSCSGVLEEDYGYLEPTPKLIIFFQTDSEEPTILSSRLIDRQAYDATPVEVSSLNIRDLNFDLTAEAGIRAEHGRLADLHWLDMQNRSRLYDRLLEEAAELCTAGILDPDQRQIEMEKVMEEIEAKATAYISYDYSAKSSVAELQILYEWDGLVLRTRLQRDFRIL